MPITHVDAAFNSFKHNECYVFVKEKYAVVNYVPGKAKHEILKGPLEIGAGFPFLKGTPFEYGIDCAFDTQNNEAYIFSGNHCSKINYDHHAHHHQPKILTGPKKIASMFTCLHGTAYEHGIDAAIRTHDHMVLLFKGNAYALMDYHTDRVHANHYIRAGFKTLVGTVFENGIDAAFKSDNKDQAYIFKDQYYACISIDYEHPFGGHLLGGRVKRIQHDWSNVTALLNCAN